MIEEILRQYKYQRFVYGQWRGITHPSFYTIHDARRYYENILEEHPFSDVRLLENVTRVIPLLEETEE